MIDLLFLLDLLIYAVESLFLILFASKILRKRFCFPIIFLIMFFLQLLKIVLGIEGILGTMLFFAVDILSVYFCYKGDFKKKLFTVTLFYASLAICDMLAFLLVLYVGNLLSISNSSDELHYVSSFLSKLFILIVVCFFGKVSKTENSLQEWMRFLPIPSVTIIAFTWIFPYSLNKDGEIAPLMFLICVFGMLSNVVSYGVVRKSAEENRLRYHLRVNQEFRDNQAIYFHDLQSSYCRLEHTVHDIKQHFDYLEAEPELEMIKDYIKRLRKKELYKTIQFTGNLNIDTILNAKYNDMRLKGIVFSVENIHLPSQIPWLDSVDLSIILGNALSNAIEACERCNGKNIYVAFQYHNYFLSFSIENPTASGPLAKKYGTGFMSSKGKGHGIGMANMEMAVLRYDGLMEYKVENGIFILDILLQAIVSSS